MDGTDQIELIDRWNCEDDHSASGCSALPPQIAVSVGHSGSICSAASRFANRNTLFWRKSSGHWQKNASALLLRFLPKVAASRGGTIRHRWIGVLAAVVPVLFAAKTSGDPQTQTEKLSYAQIGFMRPWTSAIPSTWKRGTSVLFIFRNSFVIPSVSGFSANKKLRIWADSFRLARDSDAIQ